MNNTFLAAAAVAFAVSTPSFAANQDFRDCDGYDAPGKVTDGITKGARLWGLAATTADVRKTTGWIEYGPSGMASCDAALADPGVKPEFWLRRAHLLQAKALHAIAAGQANVAEALLESSDAIGRQNASPEFDRSIGLGNQMIRAFMLSQAGRETELIALTDKIVQARPWSATNRRIAALLRLRREQDFATRLQLLKGEIPIAPEETVEAAEMLFLRGEYAAAADMAANITFDLPKLRRGWTIEGEENRKYQLIEARAQLAGLRAYALAATGQSAAAQNLVTEARRDLDEASAQPEPRTDGKPPKKSVLEDYMRRQASANAGRTQLDLWEKAIAFRASVATRAPQTVLDEYNASPFRSLGILPDILSQLQLRNPAEIQDRNMAFVQYRKEFDEDISKKDVLDVPKLANSLPRPETPEMNPVLKPAGDGIILSDTGLSRAREQESDIWTIRYTHPTAPIATAEELVIMGAAQTALEQGKDGFIVLSRRSIAKTTHVVTGYNYTPMGSNDVASGYEAQIRVQFVNSAALPSDLRGADWRVIRASEVLRSLREKYRQSKSITIAF